MKFPDFIKSFDFDDYNFDGFPDFRFANDQLSTQHNYFLYYEPKQIFTKDYLISSGYDVIFNADSMMVQFEQRYAGFEIKTTMRGIGLSQVVLENFSIRSLKLDYQEGEFHYADGVLYEVNGVHPDQPLNLYQIAKGGFQFQEAVGYRYRIHDPSTQQYGNARIYGICDTFDAVVFQMETSVAYSGFDTTLYVEDYNFDGVMDVKIWDQSAGTCTYLFYDEEQKLFLEDPLVSNFDNWVFDPSDKTLTCRLSDQFYIRQDQRIDRETYTVVTYTLSGYQFQSYEVKTEVIHFLTNEKSTEIKRYRYINHQLTEIPE